MSLPLPNFLEKTYFLKTLIISTECLLFLLEDLISNKILHDKIFGVPIVRMENAIVILTAVMGNAFMILTAVIMCCKIILS